MSPTTELRRLQASPTSQHTGLHDHLLACKPCLIHILHSRNSARASEAQKLVFILIKLQKDDAYDDVYISIAFQPAPVSRKQIQRHGRPPGCSISSPIAVKRNIANYAVGALACALRQTDDLLHDVYINHPRIQPLAGAVKSINQILRWLAGALQVSTWAAVVFGTEGARLLAAAIRHRKAYAGGC